MVMKKIWICFTLLIFLSSCSAKEEVIKYQPREPGEQTYTELDEVFVEVTYLFRDAYDENLPDSASLLVEVLIFPKSYSDSIESLSSVYYYPELIKDYIVVPTRRSGCPSIDTVDLGEEYNVTGLGYSCETSLENSIPYSILESFLETNPTIDISYNGKDVTLDFPSELIRVLDQTTSAFLDETE